MMSGYAKRFIEWQNYVHYLLLTIALSFFLFLVLGFTITGQIFIQFFLWIFVGDSIVHAIFWYADDFKIGNLKIKLKWMQWRD